MAPAPDRPVGRFAPSPTGELHFGSLVAAVGSRLHALNRGGRWRVRVEDIDPPREIEGSAEHILADLERFGMRPDGPVLFQSSRLPAHHAVIERLLERGLAYPCGCSRADLPSDGVYPGTCRDGLPPGRRARTIRVRTGPDVIRFEDGVHGPIASSLADDCGDFVIRRADGLPAYQLAVVVDDAHQGVTEVVRGADLLNSTARQIHLQRLLGLPQPVYLHLPLAVDQAGRKLSKRDADDPAAKLDRRAGLAAALRFLGQDVPSTTNLDRFWAQAIAGWDPARVPARVNAAPAD